MIKLIVFLALLLVSCAQASDSALKHRLQTAANEYCSNPTTKNEVKLRNFLNAYESQESARDAGFSFPRAVLDGSVNCQEKQFKKTTTSDGAYLSCDSTAVDVEFGPQYLDCSFSFELDEGIYFYEIYAYNTISGSYIYIYPTNYYFEDNSASTTVQSGTTTFTLPQYAPSGTWTVNSYVYSPGYNYYAYGTAYFQVQATVNDNGPPVLTSISFPYVDTISSTSVSVPFSATDDLTGVVEFYAFWYDSSETNYLGYAYWTGGPALTQSGLATGYLNNVPFGTYYAYIELYDQIGFSIELSPDVLAAEGFPNTIINAGNNCTAGHYLPAGTTGACKLCPAGTYSGPGSIACTACPPGTKGNGKGATACITCDVGYFSNGGTAACTLCTAGHYSNNPGTAVCTPCNPGTYASATGSTTCDECPPGTHSCAGASTCAACAAGTYANGYYSSYCSSCPAGSYSAAGATSCSPCPVGTYVGKVGATSCNACPSGETSPAGSSSLVACS